MAEIERVSLRVFGRDITLACPSDEKDALLSAAEGREQRGRHSSLAAESAFLTLSRCTAASCAREGESRGVGCG